MIRPITTAAAVLAVALMTGCAADPDAAPTVTPTTPSTGQADTIGTLIEAVTDPQPARWQPVSLADLMLGPPAAPLEDEPGFSCVTDGNQVCGPDNAEGVPAGRYDEGGVLVDPWPVDWTLVNRPHVGSGAQPGPAS